MNNKTKMFSGWSEVTSEERNRIVFERLNQRYGAYQIRTNYDNTLLKAFSSTVLLAILLSGLFLFSPKIDPPVIIPDTGAIRIDPPVTDPPIIPPIIPPVIPSGGGNPTELTAPVVVDSILKKDSVPQLITETIHPNGNSKDTSGTGPENIIGKKGIDLPVEGVDSTYDMGIDEPPTFPGGDKALFGFLIDNISYPEMVRDAGGKGTVGVLFVLDKEGNVTDVSVHRATKYSELNKEAVRVISKLPKWNPGKQHGRPVKVKIILPIRFELKQ